MKRHPSLTVRMAKQLELSAFALEALLASVPTARPVWADPAETYPLSPHQGYAASTLRLIEQARALVTEHQKRRPA